MIFLDVEASYGGVLQCGRSDRVILRTSPRQRGRRLCWRTRRHVDVTGSRKDICLCASNGKQAETRSLFQQGIDLIVAFSNLSPKKQQQ